MIFSLISVTEDLESEWVQSRLQELQLTGAGTNWQDDMASCKIWSIGMLLHTLEATELAF